MARLASLAPRVGTLDLRSTGARLPESGESAERQRKAEHDRWRGSARERGYDAEWQALRDAVVIERGCKCERCGSLVVLRKREVTRTVPVAEVDHIISIEERPDLRLERSNLRVLCKPCHSRRTATEQGFARGGRAR